MLISPGSTLRGGVGALLVAGTVLMQGCSDDIAVPDSDRPALITVPTSGVQVTGDKMDDRLTRLTRALALALGQDGALRSRIRDAMLASSYPESKLEFAALIADPSLGLASRMDATGDLRTSAALDSIVPLELYLPVAEHRSWSGDGNMLVASLLSDDTGEISAFDLTGTPVDLGLDEPPQRPTLALVPAETDFSRPPRPSASPSMSLMSGDALRMTSSYVTDTHETWLLGSPEIAVHVAVYAPNGTVTWISCAGDGQSGDFHFDQNNNSWSGDVTIATQAMLEDETYEAFLWEDDGDRCDGTNYLKPNEQDNYIDNLTATGKAAVSILPLIGAEGWKAKVVAAANVVYNLISLTNNDDFIGVAAPLPGNCFEASTGAQELTLKNRSGTYKGNIDLVNDFAEREKCPFKVEILGPDEAQPNDYCNWSLSFSNGQPPYSIQWSGLVSGSGTTAATTVTSSGWVNVSVTDDNDENDGDALFIDVDAFNQNCLL